MSACDREKGVLLNRSDEDVVWRRPNTRHEHGLFRAWAVMLQNLRSSRMLIWLLFKRDFLAAYKKSFIGFAWIFITPLLGIVQWIFLQRTGILNPGDAGVPYPVYVLVGTTMWGLFVGMFNAAAATLTAGQALVMQVNYPHEAFLFKEVAQQMARFVISFVMVMVVLAAFRVIPAWTTVLLPLVVLPMFFLASAAGLVASMLGVVAVDIRMIINMALGLLMWASPIIYVAPSDNAFVRLINRWNPLTYLVCSARDIVLHGHLYEPSIFALCSGVAFVLFLLSWRLFYVSESQLIERMV